MITYWMRYRDIPSRELGPATPGWNPTPPRATDYRASIPLDGMIALPGRLTPAQEVFGGLTEHLGDAPTVGPTGQSDNRERGGYAPQQPGTAPASPGASAPGGGARSGPRGGLPGGIFGAIGGIFGPIGRAIGGVLDVVIGGSRRETPTVPSSSSSTVDPTAWADPNSFLGFGGYATPSEEWGLVGVNPGEDETSFADIYAGLAGYDPESQSTELLPEVIASSDPGHLDPALDAERDLPYGGPDSFGGNGQAESGPPLEVGGGLELPGGGGGEFFGAEMGNFG